MATDCNRLSNNRLSEKSGTIPKILYFQNYVQNLFSMPTPNLVTCLDIPTKRRQVDLRPVVMQPSLLFHMVPDFADTLYNVRICSLFV